MKKNGFTLVELIIVLIIIGILAGVALPSYLSHIIRSRLTEAFDSLATYHVRMEQAYQDTGNYAVNNVCAISMSATEHFSYQCQLSNSNQSYTITATANGVHNMSGYTFTIDQSGTRRTTAFPAATVPVNCWLTSPGGC